MSGPIRVDVIYAERARAWRAELAIPAGSTAADALALLARRHPDWPQAALVPAGLAVYGREVAATQPLHHGDRLELLRALPTDPKRARRARAAR